MPVITENAGKSMPQMRQYCQGVYWKEIAFEWRERKDWDQIQWTSNKFGRPVDDDEHQQQEAAALLLQQQHSSILYAYKTEFSKDQMTPK